jgi:hypothetical protein
LIDGTLADQILLIKHYSQLYAYLLIKNTTDIKKVKAALVTKGRFGQQPVEL